MHIKSLNNIINSSYVFISAVNKETLVTKAVNGYLQYKRVGENEVCTLFERSKEAFVLLIAHTCFTVYSQLAKDCKWAIWPRYSYRKRNYLETSIVSERVS